MLFQIADAAQASVTNWPLPAEVMAPTCFLTLSTDHLVGPLHRCHPGLVHIPNVLWAKLVALQAVRQVFKKKANIMLIKTPRPG